ncbi:Rhs element Vgr protein [Duganella sp. CF517]|uniref:type VI secretion system Vgr family protein n=1 Tax=Duganella sp. CF517 TaxID=1881038 RepID=UPI0008CFDFF3|nr:type VI secretion system Vgr family protein [Duganella sp. CF517]SEO09719.1 Rhs element Vgr protein [Duganella sp. CF517]
MSALLNSFTQDTRVLTFSTPIGRDMLLAECFRGEEGLSECYEFKVTALSTDAGIPLKSLHGQPVLLELLTATSRDDKRPFHGHITSAERAGADGGFARYVFTIGPWYAFLAHGRDSRIFQDKTVFDILDAIFGGWQNVGPLVPAWRYDILDKDVYPIRSLTCQYQESNMAFAERLMREEGLFYYFEHTGNAESATLGSHTMVIADHNGSFKQNAQATINFTQPGAVMKEDSIDRWRTSARQQTNAIELSSWDYRTTGSRPVSSVSVNGDGGNPQVSRDTPGAYAYESRKQGQRIADNQMQALDAMRETHIGAGTVRTLSAGTTFTLNGQAQLDAASATGDDDARTFVIVRVVHLAHNNLSTEAKTEITKRMGQSVLDALIQKERNHSLHAVGAEKGERPVYRNRIDAIGSKTPYRSSGQDGHGQLLNPRPTVRGQQTAIVVGPAGEATYTDRDHRIKVQFHWQRGAGENDLSHSRLNHPSPDGHAGAPANEQSGTWVRIATPMAPVAGANWGSVAVPRIGSEVLIDFLDGDIDRPVVIGSLYNGRGQDDAQNNQVAQGAGVSTGNAPAWFPGVAGAHAHQAVLSGFKTQAMNTSQNGSGAYSQLVFDDTAGQSRVALQRHANRHQGTAELNMGHLRHHTDNQRLNPVGFGAELKTEHGAAIRAGSGLLLSTDARINASGNQLDSREAQAQIDQSLQLQTALATTAQKHNAMLKDDKGQAEPAPEKLPSIAQMAHCVTVIEATDANEAGGDGASGAGTVTAYAEPHLQLSSPAGIAATTPADAIISAGNTSSITAGQDINFAAQGNSLYAVKGGIGLFTYGKADSKDKPNQETGITLHAASGKVSSQSQSDETRITADKAITVTSITKSVSIAAKEHVLLTSQGAYIKLEGGDIMIHGPGTMTFKASMKELAGPASSAPVLPPLPKIGQINNFIEFNHHWPDLTPVAGGAYRAEFADGTARVGKLDAKGHARLENIPQGAVKVYFGEDPKPFTPDSAKDAGKTTLENVQNDLKKHGHSADPDHVESLLYSMAGRDIQ